MTAADVYVVLALLTLALAMWLARRFVGFVLRLLPAVAAVGGTWGAIELYRAGEQMGWDTSGSAGVLILWIVLAVTLAFALGGWITVGLQVRRLLHPAPRPAESGSTQNRVTVAIAIACVVGGLASAYRYYRAHQPSHDEPVAAMAFARDGAALYSLDRSGVLKKWYAERALEADSWILPEQGTSSALLVSDDGRLIATLDADRLSVWRIVSARPAERIALLDHALAAVPVDARHFALLARSELSVRAWENAAVPQASTPLPAAALTAAPYGEHGVVVGFADSTLAFYELSAAGVERREVALPAPLRAVPRAIRADRTGRFLVVADGSTGLAVLDLQAGGQNVIPLVSPVNAFAISAENQLLIAELVDVRRYDLAGGRSEPLFNHGGAIGALATSPAADTVAIADRQNIWVRHDSSHYAAPEVWLTGAVRFARLAELVRRGTGSLHR
jgi:hypothetical protein